MPTKKKTVKTKDLSAKDPKGVKAGSFSSLSNVTKSIGDALSQVARKQ